jgi:hypothetical protein
MRKIKASNSYLKNQTRKNLAKAALCLIVFGVVLLAIIYLMVQLLQKGLFEETYIVLLLGLIFMLVALIGFYYYIRKYHIFNGGYQGEKQVAKLLNNSLSGDYYLINDLYLREGGGDIDHIVLAPGGVFVLETKNWNGSISVSGDEWHRGGKHDSSSSPSRQVNRNTARIKNIIDSSPSLRSLGIWVEGIVVLTNRHSNLHINNSTVPILKLSQLPNYISTHGSARRFSREQLEAIGKELSKQKA